MRSKRILAIALAAIAVTAVPAIAFGRPVFVGGSTSVEPLAKKLAAAYHHAYPRRPIVKVSGGQSDIGITGVASGRFDIGDSSRDPENPDKKLGKLTWIKIARDAVCVVTNKSNPVANFSKQTIERIYTGVYTRWSQVPGSSAALKNTSISVFDRDSASGTQDAFRHIFLPGKNGEAARQVTPRASALASNGQERAAVQGTPGAIGFVSLAFTSGVHSVPYNGVPCTLHNARSGQYLGTRNFWMIAKGKPKGATLDFLRWVISGNRTTKSIINSNWIAVH